MFLLAGFLTDPGGDVVGPALGQAVAAAPLRPRR
jgi:hypothetical protein